MGSIAVRLVCRNAAVAIAGVALTMFGRPAAQTPSQTWFSPPGWDNVSRPDGNAVAFVFRPMAHVADGAVSTTAGESLHREQVGFPLESWMTPAFRGAFLLNLASWPLCFESWHRKVLAPAMCFPMARRVEHSVGLQVERDPKGTVVRIVGAPSAGAVIPGVLTKDSLSDADLSELSPAVFAGPLPVAATESDVPERLAVALRACAPVDVVHEIVATLRYEQLPWTVGGDVVVSEHRLRGVVAADGRFRVRSTIDHLDEQDRAVAVTTEASCDLRGLALRSAEFPYAVVWPIGHGDASKVLASSARFALPLIAWARDPTWLGAGKSIAWEATENGEWRGTPRLEGLGGELRCRLVESEHGWLVESIVSQVPELEGFRTELEFADYFEVAPGFLRPRVVRYTEFQNGAPDTRVELRIERAAIPSARRKFEWLPRKEVSVWHIIR
ncbi:MAG: hypothetical protein AB7I19_19920 [Planctomycetota bacterium]